MNIHEALRVIHQKCKEASSFWPEPLFYTHEGGDVVLHAHWSHEKRNYLIKARAKDLETALIRFAEEVTR